VSVRSLDEHLSSDQSFSSAYARAVGAIAGNEGGLTLAQFAGHLSHAGRLAATGFQPTTRPWSVSGMVMERLHGVALAVSRAGAVFGGALLLLASVIICVDVTLRSAFSWTVGGADELAGYALAISSAWGFSAALLHRAHIRIDTVYVRVRPRARATLDVINLAVFAAFIGFVAWYGWGVLAQSYVAGSRSLSDLETPVVVPQAIWFAGLLFFVLTALLLLARTLPAYAAGNYARVFELIGSRSAIAEAEEEIQATERAMKGDAQP
jgi:TRAP-type C4-dicarboxylate transport system permease small subunit